MSADLQFLEEWIPERMDPGTIFMLETMRSWAMCNARSWQSSPARVAEPSD